MGIKYISDHQVIEINYQGAKRVFKIVSICTSTVMATVEDSFESLTLISDKSCVVQSGWRVGWDSNVSLQQSADNNVSRFSLSGVRFGIATLCRYLGQLQATQ